MSSLFCMLMQVLVASPPLQLFFSHANAKLHPGALGGAMQEVFDQIHAGTHCCSSKPKAHAHDHTLPCAI